MPATGKQQSSHGCLVSVLVKGCLCFGTENDLTQVPSGRKKSPTPSSVLHLNIFDIFVYLYVDAISWLHCLWYIVRMDVAEWLFMRQMYAFWVFYGYDSIVYNKQLAHKIPVGKAQDIYISVVFLYAHLLTCCYWWYADAPMRRILENSPTSSRTSGWETWVWSSRQQHNASTRLSRVFRRRATSQWFPQRHHHHFSSNNISLSSADVMNYSKICNDYIAICRFNSCKVVWLWC